MSNYPDIWDEELFAAIERSRMTIVQRMLARKVERYLYFLPSFSPLYSAVILNRVDIALALLAHGADVSEKYEGHSPLYTAIGDNEQIVKLLLKHGADPNLPDGRDETPALDTLVSLMWTIRDLDGTACALLDAGADPNRPSSNGCPVIVAAAHHGRSSIVLELIEHGAHVDLPTNDSVTALMVASGRGDISLVRSLLSADANPNAVCSNGAGPLSEAIRSGHAEIESMLLDAGAGTLPDELVTTLRDIAAARFQQVVPADIDVAGRDEHERTPLHNAAVNGHATMVRRLIELGADLNARDDRRRTPLMLAIDEAHREFVGVLIDAGADTLAIDRYKSSTLKNAVDALHIAHLRKPAAVSDLREIVGMLLETGIIVRSPDGRAWRDAFLAAITNGSPEIVAMFLEHGADPNIGDDNALPISAAIHGGLYDIFVMLIDAGAEAHWDMIGSGETLFYDAVGSGAIEIVRHFLSAGADPNSTGSDDRSTVLSIAAGQGDCGIVRLLIGAGASLAGKVRRDGSVYYEWLTAPVRDGNLPVLRLLLNAGAPAGDVLYEAARNGDLELVQWLLERGIDINGPSNFGETALMAAAYSCQESKDRTLANWLLDHGTDVNAVGESGSTALKSAVKTSSLVRKLLASGADPNGGHGETALMAASSSGSLASVILLLEAGAEINAVTVDGDTALRLARYYEHEKVEKLLLERGAVEPLIAREHLHPAILWNKTADILRLIDEGADPEALDRHGRPPLISAIQNECDLSVVDALLTAGADPNHLSRDQWFVGETALEQAIASDGIELVKLLLSHGADPNGSCSRVPPISRAVCGIAHSRSDGNAGMMDIVRLLLEAGASPNVHDDGPGYTPLQEAVSANDMILSRLLLDFGADPNMPSQTGFNLCGRTAFAEAIYYGHEEITQLLLDRGANIDIKDANGTTPLIYVCGMGALSPDIVECWDEDVDEERARQDREELILRLGHLLLDRGADADYSDRFGRTPLLAACGARNFSECRCSLIRLLLEAGANVNVEDEWGGTPLSYAGESGAQNIVDLLVARGAI